MMKKRKIKDSVCLQDKVMMAIIYICLPMIFVITVYPFWQTVVLSISDRKSAMEMGLHLWPKRIEITAYLQILQSQSFWNSLKNSVVRCVIGTLANLLIVSLTAYPLSKEDLPFKKGITWIFLFTMMFTGGLIPTYLVIKGLGLLNTVWALILPGVASAYNILITRNFMKSIPSSLVESALIDGAGEFYIWMKIILPLSKPVLATVALWVSVVQWNAYLDALIYMTDPDKYVLPVLLRRMLIDNQSSMYVSDVEGLVSTEESVKSAMIIISTLPIVLVYPYVQKYFSKGVMLGAVKG